MSEAPFPGDADEAAEPAVVEEESTGPDRKLVVGGALAVVALLAGGFLLLTGGGEEEFEPIARAPRKPAAAPAPTATPVRLAPVSQEQLGRDPFKPLFVESSAQPVIDLGSGSTGGNGTTGGTGGTTSPAPVASSGATPAPSKAPTSSNMQTIKFTKVTESAGTPTGSFLVDSTRTVTAGAGDVIGGSVAITALGKDGGGWFATFKVGDGSPFNVRVGQTVVLPG